MNYCSWHLSDYASATQHLSWDEDCAYRRLIDIYYLHEAPIPKRSAYRLARATSRGQRAAVDRVLEEFFDERADGFHNARCDEVLDEYQKKSHKAKAAANERWRIENEKRSHHSGNAFASTEHSDGNANAMPPTSHHPLPTTDYKDGKGNAGAREPLADLEVKLREAAGWQSEPAPKLSVTGEIQALIDSGADLEVDVLPVIRAFAPQVRSRTSWKYFLGPIAQARDDRIAALHAVSATPTPRSTNGSHQQKSSRARNDAIVAAVIDEAERRETEDRRQGKETPFVELP